MAGRQIGIRKRRTQSRPTHSLKILYVKTKVTVSQSHIQVEDLQVKEPALIGVTIIVPSCGIPQAPQIIDRSSLRNR